MKLALVILHTDPMRGGAERYTAQLASTLARRGHEVAVLHSDPSSDAKLPAGVSNVALRAGGLTRTGRYTSFLNSLDQHLAGTTYDIVHSMLPVRRCDAYHPHAGLAVTAASTMSWIKRLFNPRPARFARVERELLTSARPPGVLCLSERMKQDVATAYPGLGNRLAVLFNGVDINQFQPKPPLPREQLNALIVAQDFGRKGVAQAIEALAKLHDNRLRLTVVGRGNTAPYFRRARTLGVSNRVTFAGATKDVRSYYADADFFVLPTRSDPCSLVVLEALAMGLPVISTRVNGACEIMQNGVQGFILDDPNDVNTLALAMKKLMDPVVRSKMRNASLDLRRTLSFDRHVDVLLFIYRRILNTK